MSTTTTTAPATPTVSTDALREALDAGAVAEFWNVLTDEYFTGIMIPGSRRVPLDRVGREAAYRGIARDAAIVVYCSGPSCPQSHAAGAKLTTLGFTNVRVYEGGLAAWHDAGLPLASSPAPLRATA